MRKIRFQKSDLYLDHLVQKPSVEEMFERIFFIVHHFLQMCIGYFCRQTVSDISIYSLEH